MNASKIYSESVRKKSPANSFKSCSKQVFQRSRSRSFRRARMSISCTLSVQRAVAAFQTQFRPVPPDPRVVKNSIKMDQSIWWFWGLNLILAVRATWPWPWTRFKLRVWSFPWCWRTGFSVAFFNLFLPTEEWFLVPPLAFQELRKNRIPSSGLSKWKQFLFQKRRAETLVTFSHIQCSRVQNQLIWMLSCVFMCF